MKRSRHGPGVLLGCVAGACAASLPAAAGDWTVKTSLSETISVNDNLGLDVDSLGVAFGSNSSIGLDATARSHVYDFNLKANLGYQTYFGEGAEETADSFRPSLSSSYVRRGKSTTFSSNLSYIYTPASESQGLEVDSTDNKSDRQTLSGGKSIAYKVNALNDLTLSARASRTDFLGNPADDENGSTSAGSSLSWLHRATKRTDFTLSTGVDWYGYDDKIDSGSFLYFVKGGVSARLSPRLSVTASAGPQFRDAYKDVKGDRNTSTIGGLGDIGFSYKLKSSSLSGSASYGLSPDSNGDLQNSLSARLNYSYQINDHSKFGIGAQARFSDDGTGNRLNNTRYSISPSYSYTLARDWQLSASYQFATSDDSASRWAVAGEITSKIRSGARVKRSPSG